MKKGWVYILRCSDGSYYTGSTSNPEQRIEQHKARVFSGYTRNRLPFSLIFTQEFADVAYAVRAERQIKGWSRRKKEALVTGDLDLLKRLATCRADTLVIVSGVTDAQTIHKHDLDYLATAFEVPLGRIRSAADSNSQCVSPVCWRSDRLP